ncbi:fibronectin type III domain-containing protein [Maricaulis sp.]|uniref:fibronectin type III domain-containing protein n=1 Tax=Maricaulis sp. TaxID=1486257 RepID=UPI003297D1EE
MTDTATGLSLRPTVPALRARSRAALEAGTAVTLALHPFDLQSVDQVQAPAGASLADMAEAFVADPVIRAHLVAHVDGVAVPREVWGETCPAEGARVLMSVRPAGGDGGKILRTVLQIALIAAASWIGAGGLVATFGQAFAQGTIGAALAAASVVVVGSLAINALVPPPQPSLDGIASPDPVYSVDGARNRATPYQPFPTFIGTHRIYPPLQGMPVKDVAGDQVWLRYLLNLGPMPLDYANIRIGETPIDEYAGVEYEVRAKPGDAPISLYRDDPYTEELGVVLDGAGWVSRTSQTKTTELIAIVFFPKGLGQIDSKGKWKSLSASVNMRYRPAGSSGAWTYARASAPQANAAAADAGRDRFGWFDAEPDLDNWTGNLPGGTVSGAETITRSAPGKPFAIQLRAAVPEGQYEVELQRTDTPQGDDKTLFDQMQWSALRSISSRNPMPVDGFAYMAVRIKASDQLNGVIDTINLDVTRIAETLDPAIADDEDADLSAVTPDDWPAGPTQYASDGALFLYRGGHTAKPRPDDAIDWPAWSAFHQWCKANDYKCNRVFDRPISRGEAARQVCAAARARPVQINGKLSVIIDGERAEGERQLFTPRSTRGFRFRKTFPGEVHGLRVPFINENEGYRSDEMLVFADGYSELGEDGGGPAGTVAATLYEQFEVPGVTDPDQVWKLARFWLYTSLYQTEVFEFDVDIESLVSHVGHLAAVAHDVMLVGLGSGRVEKLITDEAGDVTGIVLDEKPDLSQGRLVMEAGKAYGIRWRQVTEAGTGSGSFRVSVSSALPLATVPGAAHVLTLPEPVDPAEAPALGELVAFGEFGKETAQILIKRIRPGRNFGAKIEAVAYAPERFLADQGEVPAFDTRITLPRVQTPPTPALAAISVTADGIFVSYTVPDTWADNLEGFRVRWRQTPQEGSDNRFEALADLDADARVVALPPGQPGRTYDVEITALGTNGRAGEPLIVTEIGADETVPVPAEVVITPATFAGPSGSAVPGVTISWASVEDPRIAALLIYARVTGSGAEYLQVDIEPPRTGAGDVRGLTPGETYDFRLAFRNERGAETAEPAEVLAVTVPDTLRATHIGTLPAGSVQDFVDDLGNLALTVMQEALDRRSDIRRNIADVWSTFGTAQGFLNGVIEWTDQAELYSIAASESATAAGNSASAAAGFAGQAQTYADNAGNSASAANLSAVAAADSATAAGNSAGAAAGWAAQAQTYADNAGNSASAASLSATAAAESANDAGQSASAAAQFVLDAQSWADAAAQFSSATLTLKAEAQTAANQASSSATQAANSSTAAASAASLAEDHAQTAEGHATSASTSAAAADGSATQAAQSAIVTAVYGASAKQDVVDAADYFTQSLNTLAFADGVLTHWIEEVVTGVGTVVYSENATANFCARARFRPVPGRRYRCTASWRWVSGTVGTVEVGFRADAADGSGANANRWSAVTAGASGEWREASYEITATEAMALESWRPVIRRSGNTGRMEIRALVWEDLSALRAVGQDTVAVYSTRDEAMAARIIQVSAGDAFAAIQLAARQANGTASSVLRFAAQLFGFGADFDTPRFFIDAVNNAVYGVADDGTTRTFELDFDDDGRLRIWKADGTLQFDSAGGGVYTAGIIENAATRMAFANQVGEFDMWGAGYGPGSSSNPLTRVFDQSVEFTDAEPGRPVSVFANFTHLINGGAFDWCNVCWELYRHGRSVSAPSAGAGTSGKVKLLSSTEEMQGATAGRVLQPATVTSGGAAFPVNHNDMFGDQLPGTGDGDFDATGYVYLMRVRVKATALLAGTNPYENANSHSGTRTHKVAGANLLAIQLKR